MLPFLHGSGNTRGSAERGQTRARPIRDVNLAYQYIHVPVRGLLQQAIRWAPSLDVARYFATQFTVFIQWRATFTSGVSHDMG